MPKRFGHTCWALAIVVLALNFTGCRTATSKLASVPGMGWLDRSDEGGAGYEPAPGLPTPSSTSEPTMTGNRASSIAQNMGSTSRSSLGDMPAVAGKSRDRFDPKYAAVGSKSDSPKGSDSRSDSSQYAYGKYGAVSKPKSSISTQKGLYDDDTDAITPKYASSASTKGYDASDSPYFRSNTKSDAVANAKSTASTPPYSSYASTKSTSSDTKIPAKYDPYSPPPSKSASSDSDVRDSRFGSSSAGTTPAAPTQVANLDPPSSAMGSRFGDIPAAAQNVATGLQNQVASTTQQAIGQAQQTFNKYENAAVSTATDYTNAAKEKLANAGQTLNSAATSTYNQYAEATQNSAGGYLDAAKSTVSNLQNQLSSSTQNTVANVANQANRFMGQQSQAQAPTYQPTAGAAAQQAANSVASQTQAVEQFATDSASRFANGVQNNANSMTQAVGNRFGAVAQQASQTLNNTYQNAQQTTNNAVQNSAQGAIDTAKETYQQATTNASQYANSLLDSATSQVSSKVNGAVDQVTDSPTYRTAATTAQGYLDAAAGAVQQTQQAASNIATTAKDSVMKNVSASPSAASAYPTTNTPNPFVIPGYSSPSSTIANPISNPNSNVTPPPANNMQPPATNAAPTNIQRSQAPFRPGSTSNLQGSLHTTKKQEIRLTGAESSRRNSEELVLAVGDTMQFPRMLR